VGGSRSSRKSSSRPLAGLLSLSGWDVLHQDKRQRGLIGRTLMAAPRPCWLTSVYSLALLSSDVIYLGPRPSGQAPGQAPGGLPVQLHGSLVQPSSCPCCSPPVLATRAAAHTRRVHIILDQSSSGPPLGEDGQPAASLPTDGSCALYNGECTLYNG
jgi:hypothetical protein